MRRRILLVVLPALSFLLPTSKAAQRERDPFHAVRQEPADAASLILQAEQQIANFGTDLQTKVQTEQLARFIPEGKRVRVTLFYRVVKPAPAEAYEARMLDDIHPFPVKYLAERGVKYKEEETEIVGTGAYTKRGAPAYPEIASNKQVGWIDWNQWKEKSQAWLEERRTSLPPDQYQVQGRGTAVNRAGLEADELVERKPFVPQVSEVWVETNRKILGSANAALRNSPNAALLSAYDALREAQARAPGQPWSPEPGGVLLSPEMAGTLGDGLTIERVEYDGGGKVRVVGRHSAMALDRDLLATTLRLAFGTSDIPYFSLDPHTAVTGDWIDARLAVGRELTARLRSDGEFARRFRELSFETKDHKGDPHRIAFLDRIDPALARSIEKRVPMDMDLVFKPRWLARTRLGEMLFIADQSLKELWFGAAVWSEAPSRILGVPGSERPKFFEEPQATGFESLEALGFEVSQSDRDFMKRLQPKPVSTRWWFTPGGSAMESDRSLDLSEVQPVLQSERQGGDGTVSYEVPTGVPGLNIKSTLVLDPFASIAAEDPWSKRIIEHVNHNFDAYAKAVPEWEALREIFRAYVFAVWLKKHDPALGRRLLAELPAPRPPSRPLPAVWPDQRLLVARLENGSLEIGQTDVIGGIGFEQPLLRSTAFSADASVAASGIASSGAVTSLGLLTGGGFAPSPADDDVRPTPEGYQSWRQSLIRERGFAWKWVLSMLDPREILAFAGIATLLAGISLIRERRARKPIASTITMVLVALDVMVITGALALSALHPSMYSERTGPFTGWVIGAVISAFVFLKLDRPGRFGAIVFVMTIALAWTAFTPGLGEITGAWTPLRLAIPPLEGAAGGPLTADTVYVLQALEDGLDLSRSSEPRYAWYPVLWLFALAGFWLQVRHEVPNTPAK